ncbi:hypothetical protein WR25_19270 [Diploscapter pachys]|uniref:Uncharacterized protein n=1 Tax=Diploscapter pachys TaxID=2018661 RepID=A0A2A2LAT4_9BILA|nr:hypothetical protein WR25_19270 [Diploscapter pachys]
MLNGILRIGYPPQAVPNNNLAIGYPTAYGLWAGKTNQNNGWNTGMWNGDNNGPMPNQGTGFGSPLKCMNGGAHIGQCRLDRDSICIALGGICVHGACCTTPFAGVMAPFSKGRTFKPHTTTKDPENYTVTIEPEKNSEELDELTRLIEEAKTMRPVTMVTITEAPDVEEESYEEVNEKV